MKLKFNDMKLKFIGMKLKFNDMKLKFNDMKLKFKQSVQQCFMCLEKKIGRKLHGILTAVKLNYFF